MLTSTANMKDNFLSIQSGTGPDIKLNGIGDVLSFSEMYKTRAVISHEFKCCPSNPTAAPVQHVQLKVLLLNSC